MLVEDGNKDLTVLWFQEMRHFVDNDIFQQVFWLFHQFGIEPDTACLVIAASPFGFHSLEKIVRDGDPKFFLPFVDQWRYLLVKKGFVPAMEYFGPFEGIAARSNIQGYPFVVEHYTLFGILIHNGHKIASPPKVVAFALNEMPRCFSCLIIQLLLLLAYPAKSGYCIGASDLHLRCVGGNQCYMT